MQTLNLAYNLYEWAARQPDRLALAQPARPGKRAPVSGALPYRNISYKTLAEETNRLAQGLMDHGFRPGDRVAMMVPPGLEFFSLCFAFLQTGIVPVLMDPGMGLTYLKKCMEESEPVGFIGITRAQAASVLLGWARKTVKKRVTIGRKLFWGGTLLGKIRDAGKPGQTPVIYPAQSGDLAAILYTSGSTGAPKGVMYTHGNFYQQAEIIRHTFKVRPGETDLPTFPPFALFNPAAGMSTVIPDMDPSRPAHADPEKMILVMRQFEVTSMFGSPALLDRLGRYATVNGIQLPGLKRVFSAGAPVPPKVIKRFSALLDPSTTIYTPYGSTEAMPVTVITGSQILTEKMLSRSYSGAGICIGQPVEAVQVKIIRITDKPIETWTDDLEQGTGVVGEIVVKGKNVTRAYFQQEEATRLAKIREGEECWHRMGDLGYRDTEGNIWFCGRKSHRVQVPGKELYSVQCESVFNPHPKVFRTALVGVRGKAVLCVELEKDTATSGQERIRKELLEWAGRHEITQDIQTFLFHPSFPVDTRHNAKIFREKLAAWAAKRLS